MGRMRGHMFGFIDLMRVYTRRIGDRRPETELLIAKQRGSWGPAAELRGAVAHHRVGYKRHAFEFDRLTIDR